jgi:hypothetical protein
MRTSADKVEEGVWPGAVTQHWTQPAVAVVQEVSLAVAVAVAVLATARPEPSMPPLEKAAMAETRPPSLRVTHELWRN